ncbi:ATP-grasp domain-containing protein [Clostridium sp. HBUAS56010]|uniref:ATP-grasp domain-containing protein n=1 Tax=Clostridium sp. HBUAS56010 TaxID=2571127 RepID=UPI0011784B7F|nr:ATP-grasp domain-containing protein [Clostridium sp. HBUAS56010]
METALVTAIGSFSADIVIKNLKKRAVRVIGCDIYPEEWIADSRNVDAFYQVPYATEEERYVKELLAIGVREQVNLLIVLTDVEVDVWNRHRKELKEHSITLCLSSEETIALCRDKRAMNRFLSGRNLGNSIPTRELLETEIETLSYPVVLKPFNGRSSQGLHYIKSLEEMKHVLTLCKPEEYVVQPYYKGSVITADIVRDPQSGTSIVICRRELLRTLNGAGTSVLVFSDPLLEKMCQEIAQALEIKGCVNFEFIEGEDGIYHMLECNPRFSGGVEFSCLAGYDCVGNHIRCFTGEDIEPGSHIKGMYIARKYEEYITKITGEEGQKE